MFKTVSQPEKALLISLDIGAQSKQQIEDNLNELYLLTLTAGADVVGTIVQQRKAIDPAFFIGKGKVTEIIEIIRHKKIEVLIFDDELTPTQQKNLENILDIKIIDRSALILDIFASHARTNAARTQVEAAQLNYFLPRLTKQWSHLSRQFGGMGTKGPGETQLETDRRLVRNRIAHLKKELKKIETQKTTQLNRTNTFIRVSLVGYTNAGKSSLMNALTGANGLVEDKLFATLDTTSRKVVLTEGCSIILSDTVGFIRKLPHHLIASFQTTLMQTNSADLLLHIVDMSNPRFEEQISIVKEVLNEIELQHKQTLLVMNKVDLLKSADSLIRQVRKKYPTAIFISAKKRIRLEHLKEQIFNQLKTRFIEKEVIIPFNKTYLLSHINNYGQIISHESLDDSIKIIVRIAKEKETRFNQILVKL